MKRAKTRPKARIRRKPVPMERAGDYTLEPLNPWLQCGPDTSVTELWKVRERDVKETILHLVYFDRYGWYCEHGRNCRAVAEVRRVVRTMSAIAPRPKSAAKSRTRKRK